MIRFIYSFVLIIAFVFHLNIYSQDKSTVIKNMSKKADLIVTGKVMQKKSSWNESKTKTSPIPSPISK